MLMAVASARVQAEAEMDTFREAMKLRAERRARERQAAEVQQREKQDDNSEAEQPAA